MRLALKFDNGLTIGSWELPDSNAEPFRFLEHANEIGFHVTLAIERGAKSCEFIDIMEDEP